MTDIERLRTLIKERGTSLPAMIIAEHDAHPLIPLLSTAELETALAIREVGAEIVKALKERADA